MEENNLKIGYSFSDPALEALAYTHPSCDAEHGDNQRLEFLGDAVLDLVISDALYHRLADKDEGVLDRARASLVNGKSLSALARKLALGDRLQVSQSQRNHHQEPSDSMLEDALEALVGAIYIDGGLEAARAFILSLLADRLDSIEVNDDHKSPKSRLQEWTQKNHKGSVPEYRLIESEGPDHKRQYTASVRFGESEVAQGKGTSIKAAETAAAEAALASLGENG